MDTLSASLSKSCADNQTVRQIVYKVLEELYNGISARQTYKIVFAVLKKKGSYLASKHKLKKAIYELGPTGYLFERFINCILKYSGYQILVREILQGNCVTHESKNRS